MTRRLLGAALLASTTFVGASLLVQTSTAQSVHDRPSEPPPAREPARPRAADPHAPPSRTVERPSANPHDPRPVRAPAPNQPLHIAAPGGAAKDGHGAAATQHDESAHAEAHGAHAEHDEKAPPPPINWWHGLLGEKANEPQSILWRQPGEPAPFLASLINFSVLLLIVNRYGRKALGEALVKRKESITREIDEATRMRRAAEERLGQYEVKLEKISDELERVRREFREQGERDKERIIQEAKERRDRMRKDTDIVMAQEAKQMRQELLAEVVTQATRIATEILVKNTTLGDHDRFAEAFLHQLRAGARLSVGPPAQGGSSYSGLPKESPS